MNPRCTTLGARNPTRTTPTFLTASIRLRPNLLLSCAGLSSPA
jgi:hypothetical protein